MQALLLRRDQIEYMRTRAIVQAICNKDEANNALDAYRDAQLPYLPRAQKAERSKHIERLMAEVARGPMSITPVMQKKVRSTLKTRVVQRTKEERERSKRLARKMVGYEH